MRSKLFVPGSRPELFTKAMASLADGISLDLEDAVIEARKGEARAAVRDWFLSALMRPTSKTLIVRVNPLDTPHFYADVDAVAQNGLDIINLPKPASLEMIREAEHAIAAAERRNGVSKPIKILLNIESAQALHDAVELARASQRVMGLQVGLGDLFEPLGIDRSEQSAVKQVLFAVKMAAARAGVEAFDGAFANVADAPGFLAEARLAASLGFSGKSCIHPSQIQAANIAFTPSQAEIAQALLIVNAAAQAQADGLGAFLVEGRMIDAPFLQRAHSVIDQARRYQLLPII